MSEKAYEKHAWILLFAVGMIILVVGGGDLILGESPDPTPNFTAPSFFVRAVGVVQLGFSILILALAGMPYRRGEKWSWYISWSIPAVLLGLATINRVGGGTVWPIQLVSLLVALLGLLLPYRKFFPRSNFK